MSLWQDVSHCHENKSSKKKTTDIERRAVPTASQLLNTFSMCQRNSVFLYTCRNGESRMDKVARSS